MKTRSHHFVSLALVSSLFLASLAGAAGALESRGVSLTSLYSTSEPEKKSAHLQSVSSRSPKVDARSKSPVLAVPERVGTQIPTRAKPDPAQVREPRTIAKTQVPVLEGTLPLQTVSIPEITPTLEEGTFVHAPRPRIVVLVHGMQTNDGTHEDGELITGHGYWNFEFVQGILGAETDQPLFDFAGLQHRNQSDWVSQAEGVILSEGSEGHAFVALEPISPAARFGEIWLDQAPEEPPMLSVMMTARNASVGLLRQTAQATDQMKRLLGWYRERFGSYLDRRCRCEPELVLIAHSQGGHVSRVWLSSAVVDPVDDQLNPDQVDFSEEQHETMSLIRDTTVFLATLATPHDGTIFATRGQAVYESVDTSVTTLSEEVERIEAGIDEIESVIPLNNPIDTEPAMDAANDLLDQMPDSVRDLTREYLFAINGDFLHPSHAHRSQDADRLLGDGTSNKYIPIYAFGGRSPGSKYLVDYDLVEGFEGVASDPGGVSIILMLGVDRWMASYATGWGSVEGDHADFSQQLDRVDRADLGDIEDLVAQYAQEHLIPLPLELELAGGSEDLVNWLTLGLSDRTNAGDLPIYLRENFTIEPEAATATLLDPVITCGDHELSIGENAANLPALAAFLLEVAESESEDLGDYLASSSGLSEILVQALPLEPDMAALYLSDFLSSLGVIASSSCVFLDSWRIELRDREVLVPGLIATGDSVSDDEIDSDGAVPYDSAMGFYIGSADPWSFEHTDGGAWYRRPNSPFEEEFHSGMTTRHSLGAYLYDELVSEAGPIATAADVSVAP